MIIIMFICTISTFSSSFTYIIINNNNIIQT